jgi:hypothetical protein
MTTTELNGPLSRFAFIRTESQCFVASFYPPYFMEFLRLKRKLNQFLALSRWIGSVYNEKENETPHFRHCLFLGTINQGVRRDYSDCFTLGRSFPADPSVACNVPCRMYEYYIIPWSVPLKGKNKSKAIPETSLAGLCGCKILWIPLWIELFLFIILLWVQTHLSYNLSEAPGLLRPERLGKLTECVQNNGSRTRDLPACSTLLKPLHYRVTRTISSQWQNLSGERNTDKKAVYFMSWRQNAFFHILLTIIYLLLTLFTNCWQPRRVQKRNYPNKERYINMLGREILYWVPDAHRSRSSQNNKKNTSHLSTNEPTYSRPNGTNCQT